MKATRDFSKRLLKALKLDKWQVLEPFGHELKSQSLFIHTSGCAQISVNGEKFWFPFPCQQHLG